MTSHLPERPAALVFGARNLGAAILEALMRRGFATAGVATSAETLSAIERRGAIPIRGDVTDQASVKSAFAAASRLGPLRLAVNAASPYGGSEPFGGGPLAGADPKAFDAWTAAPARGAFAFFSGAAQALADSTPPITLIQVSGGSTRRAMPGRGLWAAGCFAVRAVTQAAAQELRPRGVHACLLIVDAGIEPLGGVGDGELAHLADPYEIAEAVVYLTKQGVRAATHELQLTPLAEHWVP